MAVQTQQLTIELIAKADQAMRGLKNVTRDIKSLDAAAKQLTGGMVGVRTQVNALGGRDLVTYDRTLRGVALQTSQLKAVSEGIENQFREQADATRMAAKAMQEMQTASMSMTQANGLSANMSGSATFAVTALGQGFGDAGQFSLGAAQGIRAVNNNLQQFMVAMTMVTRQAGGLGKGLKAMGAIMMGPSGLLFLFMAVSAAMEFFSNKAQQAASKAKKAEDEFEGLRTTMASFIELQDDLDGKVAKVTLEGMRRALRDIDADITTRKEEIQGITNDIELQTRKEFEGMRLGEGLLLALKDQEQVRQTIADLIKDQEIRIKAAALIEASLGPLVDKNTKKLTEKKGVLTDLQKLQLKFNEAVQEELVPRSRHVVLMNLAIDTLKQNNALEDERISLNMQLDMLQDDAYYQELIRENAQIEAQNKKLREQLNLKLQMMGVVQISSDQLRKGGIVSNADMDRDAKRLDWLLKTTQEKTLAMIDAVRPAMAGFEQFAGSISGTISQQARISRQETIRQIDLELQSGRITQEQAEVRRAAAEEEYNARIDAAEAWFNANKALSIANAIIDTYAGATKAFAQTGVLGFVAGAAIIAAGLANVATIASTRPGMSRAPAGGGRGGGGGSVGMGAPGTSGWSTSTNALGGMAPSGYGKNTMSIELVATGRSLVGVVEAEKSAKTRVVGGSYY